MEVRAGVRRELSERVEQDDEPSNGTNGPTRMRGDGAENPARRKESKAKDQALGEQDDRPIEVREVDSGQGEPGKPLNEKDRVLGTEICSGTKRGGECAQQG